jgi:DNA polymerase-3 subunit alpha
MDNVERAASFAQSVQASAQEGQSSLFESNGPAAQAVYPAMNEISPWIDAEKLAREKSVLGFFVSGHPLMKFKREIEEFATVSMGDPSSVHGSASVRACGIVVSVKKKIDKRNNTMAFLSLEDFTGRGECIVFADTYAKFQSLLQPDEMIMVIGKGEVNGDVLKILVNEVVPLEKVREKFTKSVTLSITLGKVEENTVSRLREIFEEHKGSCPCYINVRDADAVLRFHTRRYAIEPSKSFLEDVQKALGPECVHFNSQ